MTPDETFLQAIREAPTDDAPRLIYADWLEEHGQADRAEFIRVQCRLSRITRLPETDPQLFTLVSRAEDLLRSHWQDWVDPLREIVGPWRDRCGGGWMRTEYHPEGLREFRRGFVESLSLDAERFLRHARQIQKLTPLREVRLWGAGRYATELANESTLAGLSVLGFMDYYDAPLTASDVTLLAASPYLDGLVALYLGRNSLGDEGVETLAHAPWMSGVKILDLTDNGLSDRGAHALAESPHLMNLQTLLVRRNSFSRAGIAALTNSPNLRRVTRLEYDPAPGNLLL